jgi:hypothetical protein
MFYDVDHPNVTLSEWEAFKSSETTRQSVITKVVDRAVCGFFPDWFVPLARGVAIAGHALLTEARYRKGMRRPRNWINWDPDCYWLSVGYTKGADRSNRLDVRRCDGHDWWLIERRMADVDQVLVCNFGSTPIIAPSYTSAMCLALHCNVDNPPHGLRWIKQAPDDCSGAIEFARQRRIDEAQPEGQLHKVA